MLRCTASLKTKLGHRRTVIFLPCRFSLSCFSNSSKSDILPESVSVRELNRSVCQGDDKPSSPLCQCSKTLRAPGVSTRTHYAHTTSGYNLQNKTTHTFFSLRKCLTFFLIYLNQISFTIK